MPFLTDRGVAAWTSRHTTPMKCLNCGTECTGKYCPECGQKTSTRRLRMQEVLVSFVTAFTGTDNIFWHTCVCQITRPGHMIREYLLGKRAGYYSPLPLLIYLVAIYTIVSYFVADAVTPFDLARIREEDQTVDTNAGKIFYAYYRILSENNVYFAIFSVFINTLPYRFVFRKQKLMRPSGKAEALNIAEHCFTQTYHCCFNIILAFLLLPFGTHLLGQTTLHWIYQIVPAFYRIFLYKQMLDITWWKSVLLNAIAIILGFILIILLIFLFFGILSGIEEIRN